MHTSNAYKEISHSLFIVTLLCPQKFLNNLGNYIPNAWTEQDGCLVCKEWHKELPLEKKTWPTVVLAVFVERPSPFLSEVLERVTQLDYPKSRMSLFVHNAVSQKPLFVCSYSVYSVYSLVANLTNCFHVIFGLES